MVKAKAHACGEADRERTVDFDNISNSEISHLIDEWIHSERDREIMRRRLIDGKTYEFIAEEEDMSVRQIKNIVYKCEQRLFK
jgi:DNA-directed RNA polymerase specialized sigma24 family protein